MQGEECSRRGDIAVSIRYPASGQGWNETMHHFAYRNGVLHCEDVSLEAVARELGTPAYVYSDATLRRHYQMLADAFANRDVLIAFAVKANSNLSVLATLAKQGCGADTVSAPQPSRARVASTDRLELALTA